MSAETLLIAATATIVVLAIGLFLTSRSGQIGAPDIRTLSQLRQAGSDLSKPHPIEFFVYFSDEAAARRAEQQLLDAGLSTSVAPSPPGKPAWLLLTTKTMVPTFEELVRLREVFEAAAQAEGGTYDGWEAPVVK